MGLPRQIYRLRLLDRNNRNEEKGEIRRNVIKLVRPAFKEALEYIYI